MNENKKHGKLRWNWIVSIIFAAYGLFCEVYSAIVLFGGSFKMIGSGFDLERVFGVFGVLFSIVLLMLEGIVILIAISLLTLILWGIDVLYKKIKQKITENKKGS